MDYRKIMHGFASREIFNVKKKFRPFYIFFIAVSSFEAFVVQQKRSVFDLGFKMYSIKCQNSAKNEIVKQEGGNI